WGVALAARRLEQGGCVLAIRVGPNDGVRERVGLRLDSKWESDRPGKRRQQNQRCECDGCRNVTIERHRYAAIERRDALGGSDDLAARPFRTLALFERHRLPF